MRQSLEPNSAEVFYTIGVNRFQKAFQLQNFLSQAEKEVCAADAEKNLLKAIELDPNWAESYAYMKILYINVHSKLYPERESRYMELATAVRQQVGRGPQAPARPDEAREGAQEDGVTPVREPDFDCSLPPFPGRERGIFFDRKGRQETRAHVHPPEGRESRRPGFRP